MRCAANDESSNSILVRRADGDSIMHVRADQLVLGDNLHLKFGELTPATIEVTSVASEGHQPTAGIHGYVYDREGSGEDVSKPFASGAILSPLLELTRPEVTVEATVIQLSASEHSRQVRPPDFLTLPLLVCNIGAFIIVFALALTIATIATVHTISMASADNQQSALSLAELAKEFVLHLAAGAIAEHSTIPSMRMTLLYTVFLLILSVAFWRVTVTHYPAIDEIGRLQCATFDKTGTLTDHQILVVHEWYPYCGQAQSNTTTHAAKVAEAIGWSEKDFWMALTLANSESTVLPQEQHQHIQKQHQARPPSGGAPAVDHDGVWGTSPEECEMLRYWLREEQGFVLKANPLRNELADDQTAEEGFGVVKFGKVNGDDNRQMNVLTRAQYQFQLGKLATVELIGSQHVTVEVRQTGMSFLQTELTAQDHFFSRLTRSDPRRAIGLAFRVLSTDAHCSSSLCSADWHLLGVYTFENPVRPGVASTLHFLRQRGVSVGMLTGDAQEAAEAIARETEICPAGQSIEHLGENSAGEPVLLQCNAVGSPTTMMSPRSPMVSPGCNSSRERAIVPMDGKWLSDPADDALLPDPAVVAVVEAAQREHFLEMLLAKQGRERTVAVEGRLLAQWASAADSHIRQQLREFLVHPKLNRVMYRASASVKQQVTALAHDVNPVDASAGATIVMHVGDAANDAAAIHESNVGVCLQHGASSSRAHAALIVSTPQDLIDVMATNGFADMLLIGGQRLLCDVCLVCGVAAGLVAVGLHALEFQLLVDETTGRRSFIFTDAWPQSHWMLFSNIYYISTIANSTGECRSDTRRSPASLAAFSCLVMCKGLFVGTLGGGIIAVSTAERYGFVAIHLLIVVLLGKHSWHCCVRYWRSQHASMVYNTSGFGEQWLSEHADNFVCRVLSYLDTVMARVVLYWIFCCFTFHIDDAPTTKIV